MLLGHLPIERTATIVRDSFITALHSPRRHHRRAAHQPRADSTVTDSPTQSPRRHPVCRASRPTNTSQLRQYASRREQRTAQSVR